jgi:hypothetical protein
MGAAEGRGSRLAVNKIHEAGNSPRALAKALNCIGSLLRSSISPQYYETSLDAISVGAMFLGAALGVVVRHYSISSALWLATAISTVSSAALFRSVCSSNKP